MEACLEGAAALRSFPSRRSSRCRTHLFLVERATALLGEVAAAAFAQIFVRAAALRADEAFAGRSRRSCSGPNPSPGPWSASRCSGRSTGLVRSSFGRRSRRPGSASYPCRCCCRCRRSAGRRCRRPGWGPPSRPALLIVGCEPWLPPACWPCCCPNSLCWPCCRSCLLLSLSLIWSSRSSAIANTPPHRPRLLWLLQQGTRRTVPTPNELCDERLGARKRPPPGWAAALIVRGCS